MSDEPDLQQSFTNAILDDFAERTDGDFSVVLDPLGDGIGWRATVVTPHSIELARSSHKTVSGAIDMVIAKASKMIQEAIEGDDEDAEDRI